MILSKQKVSFLAVSNLAALSIIVFRYFTSKMFLPGDALSLGTFLLFFSVFFWAASMTFLLLWIDHQGIYKSIPDIYKAKWYGSRDFEDNTMLLFATAILMWQIKHAVAFFDPIPFKNTIDSILSTINSAIFLQATTYFRFIPPAPKWVTNPVLNRLFQQPTGIWSVAGTIIVATILFTQWEIIPIEGPDTIFSVLVAFFLFSGLWQLLGEREMGSLRLLIIINSILLALAIKINLDPPDTKAGILSIAHYISIGYKMSLITLSFALVISYHSSLRKLFLDEKNLELNHKNKELDDINHELESKNQELDEMIYTLKLLRAELSHRTKNYFQTLISRLEMQLSKYQFGGPSETVSELHAVQARINALLGIHELLDLPKMEGKELECIELRKYIVDLLHRLRDSFSYPPDSFNFKLDLLPDISVKASIAPQIGMLITELALNVDQHAYHDISKKYIGIHISQFADHLLINIVDQGHGFMKSKQEQRGYGLSIVETIVKQLRGTFQLQGDQQGTHAKISLPLKNLI